MNIKKHTAIFRDVEYTLHLAGWGRLLSRSRTFIDTRLSDAEIKNVENPMQYVIDESENMRKNNVGKANRRTPVMSTAAKENDGIIFADINSDLFKSFLYPAGVQLMEKREYGNLIND